jgi:D-aminopeptidase
MNAIFHTYSSRFRPDQQSYRVLTESRKMMTRVLNGGRQEVVRAGPQSVTVARSRR